MSCRLLHFNLGQKVSHLYLRQRCDSGPKQTRSRLWTELIQRGDRCLSEESKDKKLNNNSHFKRVILSDHFLLHFLFLSSDQAGNAD